MKTRPYRIDRLVLSIVLLAMSACVAQRPYESTPEGAEYELIGYYGSFSNNSDKNIDVVDGSLSGDIGLITDIDSPATISGYHDDEYTSLEVIMTNRKGSAMALLSIFGGIDHEDLVPGSVHQFVPDTSNRNGLSVESIVCSGEGAPGNWDYDDISNVVRVEVEATEHPEVKRLNFTTYTEDDIATGHVDVVTGE